MSERDPRTIRRWYSRWLIYGGNTAVLVVATVALVVMANWWAANLSGAWSRLDVTATRQYTLSPQTLGVIRSLDEPARITTVFIGGQNLDETTRRRIAYFHQLLDEYAYRSDGRIAVEHINPAADVERFQAFAQRIREQHEKPLQPARRAIIRSIQTFQQIATTGNELAERLSRALAEAPDLPSAEAGQVDPHRLARRQRQAMADLAAALASMPRTLQLDEALARMQMLTDADLPQYTPARNEAIARLRYAEQQILRPNLRGLRGLIDSGLGEALQPAAAAVRDALVELIGELEQTLTALAEARTPRYDELTSAILIGNAAVVEVGGRFSAVALDEVYSGPAAAGAGVDVAAEQRFRGEEAVTGALIALSVGEPATVVFVDDRTDRRPADMYSYVAEQLRNLNLDVVWWNPSMQAEPDLGNGAGTGEGGGGQGDGADADGDDRRVVWVFMPPAVHPQKMAELLADALARGEPVLAFAGVSERPRFGQADAWAQALEPLGVRIDSGRLIMQLSIEGGHRIARPQMLVNQWPQGHAISEAVGGQMMLLNWAAPIDVTEPAAAGDGPRIRHWPIARTPDATWAEGDWASGASDRARAALASARPDADEPRGPLNVGLAIERGDQRVVVLSDAGETANPNRPPLIADANIFRLVVVQTPEGTRQQPTVAYPGNAELFVNSVYWLARLDEFVGAGARTQQVRRVEQIQPTQLTVARWIVLALLPLGALAAGTAVWLIRRR